MNAKHHLLVTAAAVAIAPAALAQNVTFTWLDQSFSANDVTPDGKYVVGDHAAGAYIWSLETGYTVIPGGAGTAISDDGTVIFGNMSHPKTGQQVAGRWTEATGWQSVGGLPGDGCGSLSSAYELSADGSVGVGLGWLSCSGQGFRWTDGEGMIGLEMLANGNNRASVVSADGSLAGGFAQGSFSRTPAIWHADGSGELLDPPNGDVLGEVQGISDDGSILLGNWDGSAFYRTEAEGVVTFPTLFASWVGIAMDIADDGTIVGFDTISTSRQAWIKLPGQPTRTLPGFLQDLGLEGGPTNLHVAQAISRDGKVIVGHNGPFGMGFVIRVGANLDLDGNGSIGFGDLLIILSEWGPCGDPCSADVDGDGAVGFGDLLEILSNWD